jgi:hypothetical protein
MVTWNGYRGVAHWRWIGGLKNISKVMKLTPIQLRIVSFIINRSMKKSLWAQGLGRLSNQDMVRAVEDDLRNVSTLLGNKKFLNGDEPAEDDAAVFGLLAEIMWATHDSPYEKLLKGMLYAQNAKHATERIRHPISK